MNVYVAEIRRRLKAPKTTLKDWQGRIPTRPQPNMCKTCNMRLKRKYGLLNDAESLVRDSAKKWWGELSADRSVTLPEKGKDG